jgi:CheY-like chemotaxis protein
MTPLTGRRILVAEDDEKIVKFIRTVLTPLGGALVVTDTGEEVLRLLGGAEYDLLILDQELEGRLMGAELLDMLAARWPSLPVLFATAHADDVAARIEHPNVRGILRKPFQPRDLREAVLRLLV